MDSPKAPKSKRKKKNQNPESQFRSELDIFSRNKDVSGAISLYESAIAQKLRLNQQHFNNLLYICSTSITSSDKEFAIGHGFRIFDHMKASKIHLNEATITAVARLAAAKDDGDLAFELVKSLEDSSEKPRLRSYDPALLCFTKQLQAEKAYLVEERIVNMGLRLEEQELAALLAVSVGTGNAQKVYDYMNKLRAGVRCVSESTAEIIESWFGGEKAGIESGLSDCDAGRVKEAMLRNGGGWHGLGWIGKGKWTVKRSNVDFAGVCGVCGEQLACVDIGRAETDNFAQSVASLAMEREVQSNFTKFQNWLDQNNDFEAIVDGANIGLYQQNFADGGFSISQVAPPLLVMEQLDLVVKELYNRSKKWPLVVLHNKRIRALHANASNRDLLDQWMDKGFLYATPTGSNDDWYWLYAAVKLEGKLVTNDEMRDHIFELLGSNFFPKWKERHQVHYTFVKGNLKLQMPPLYSLLIQESEKGAWHVPLAGDYDDECSRAWLCITRSGETSQFAETSRLGEIPSSINDDLSKFSNPAFNSDYSTTPAITGKRKERSPSPSRSDT